MSTREAMYEDQKARVLGCLYHGKDMAQWRGWLATHTGLQDRHVRKIIQDLREDGHLICNLQNGEGYFLAEDINDVRRQYKQDMARAMSILKRMKAFRKALKEEQVAGQIRIEDLLMDEFMILEEELSER